MGTIDVGNLNTEINAKLQEVLLLAEELKCDAMKINNEDEMIEQINEMLRLFETELRKK